LTDLTLLDLSFDPQPLRSTSSGGWAFGRLTFLRASSLWSSSMRGQAAPMARWHGHAAAAEGRWGKRSRIHSGNFYTCPSFPGRGRITPARRSCRHLPATAAPVSAWMPAVSFARWNFCSPSRIHSGKFYAYLLRGCGRPVGETLTNSFREFLYVPLFSGPGVHHTGSSVLPSYFLPI
jgi:hypothetical protein